ncbi:MAG: YjbE family putative metal transport protein [Ktedonobacterales bacterium]
MPIGIDVNVLGAIAGIVLVDLALSGDNALVIGAAAAGLPARQRAMAIGVGGAGAIVLRIAFAIAATLLLQFPLLQALGGLVLLVIAVRLLMDRESKRPGADGTESAVEAGLADEDAEQSRKQASRGFLSALLTILVADVTMSLDNVLAVGALAAGHLPLLVAGLLLSMGLLLVGSAVVAVLIGRLPWLLDVAALVLGWTAGNMILHDLRLKPFWDTVPWSGVIVHGVAIAFVLVADVLLRMRDSRRSAKSVAATTETSGQKEGPGNEAEESTTLPHS